MKLIYGQVDDQDGFHAVVSSELKELGIKVAKPAKSHLGNQQVSTGVFGGCLARLPSVCVPQQQGFVLQVPSFLLAATSVIRQNLRAEGLFRKGGSIQRQKELKQSVECGGGLEDANVHDVANLVKHFLRGLSEPLLQPRLHEPLIKAYDMTDNSTRKRAIFLLCALLPSEHLHTLRFIMAFFAEVASCTAYNKMDVNSLAIVLMPNLFALPVELDRRDKSKEKLLQKQTGLVRLLIENHGDIGRIDDHVWDRARSTLCLQTQLDDDSEGNQEARTKLTAKKKRNSLNGVFYGLRKMVQHNRMCNDEADASDGSLVERTPSQATKRKIVDKTPAQCSSAKKRTMMQLRSEKLRPIPMTHLDSPDPVHNEDEVSRSPGHLLGRGTDADLRKRKSGRMKFFGKAYLTRRTSTSRSPKPTPKKLAKEPPSSSKKQTVRRHLNEEAHVLEETPKQLSVPPPQPSPKSYHSILFPNGRAADTPPAGQTQTSSGIGSAKPVSVVTYEACPTEGGKKRQQVRLWKRESRGACTTAADAATEPDRKPQTGASKWYRAASSATKARSFVADSAAPALLNGPATPTRTVIWRPLTKSSLRRGRPNTVRTGLPAPSPFKPPAANQVLVHYTSDPGPMVFAASPQPSPPVTAVDAVCTMDAAIVAAAVEVQKVLDFGKEDDHANTAVVHGSDSHVPHLKSSDSGTDGDAKTAVADYCLDIHAPHPTRSDSVTGRAAKTAVADCCSGIHAPHLTRSDSVTGGEANTAVADCCSDIHALHLTRSDSVTGGAAKTAVADCCSDIHAPHLTRRDSGIFEPCVAAVEPRDDPRPHKALCKSPSADSGYNHGDCDIAAAAETGDSVAFGFGGGKPPPNPAAAKTLRRAKAAAGHAEWRSAVDVFRGRGGGLGQEEAGAGRPSLLWLMTDKAGSVSATARRYDEIAIASRSASAVERRHSLRSASPLVRARAPVHRRSVSRDGATAPELRRPKRDAKENVPRRRAAAEPKPAKAAVRTALTPSSGQNVQPRRPSAAVGRSKSARTSEGRAKRAESTRRSPRLRAPAKLEVAAGRRSSTIKRRSTIL